MTGRDRVLVAGGGIAGLAAAAGAQELGIEVAVYERSPNPPDGGLGVNLPGNAVVALQALGLGDDLEKMGEPVHRREYRNQRGRLLFAVDELEFWGVEAGPRCVIRADLHAALRTRITPETVRLGAEVSGVRVHDAGVEVDLGDGSVEDGGVLVAADGVRSAIRSTIGIDGVTRGALLSHSSWRFVTDDPGMACWTAWSGAAGTALLIPVGDGRVYGWVSTRNQQLTGFASVAEAFAAYPRELRDALLSAQAEPVPPYHSPLEEVRPAVWTTGRVVLTGDAAHATAPVWAQGAALAVEDALVLADLLVHKEKWPVVGAEFAHQRRQRVEHVQAMTDRLSRAATLPPWVRDLVLPVIGPRSYRATYGPLRTRGF